jgi:hypothetical protein
MANNIPKAIVKAPDSTQLFTQFITGNLSEYIKRQVLKSEYDDLIEKYKNSNELWVDPSFPHNDKSWGDPKHPAVWKRLS